MKPGIIGLGKMGGDLALQCLDQGIEVIGHAKHGHPALVAKGVRVVSTYDALAHAPEQPRLIYLSLPAGPTVDEVIGDLLSCLAKGDILMDGGNSFYEDSVRRERELRAKGIWFLDCGISGGVTGARHGACFMVGGPVEGFAIAEPVLKKLAVEGGLLHTGAPGSGHFVKLVHNGIEFGMNHAIGEGVEMLLHGGFDLDMEKVFENWSHGSIIRGWLIELMAKVLKETDFNHIPPFIEDTGEVNWLLQVAIDREIAMPITALSVMSLFQSRGSGQDSNRAVALLRHGYGGHPCRKDEAVAKERKTSRISKI